ncbi:group III truncated hemoglobin [Afifella pfennigii]|uniref:group III truncated hemoglobin n=1 Tax=Afifella pfennigii TaxID=209897 RepID=UPI000ADDF838|nr:group III truncated hemoglobin [Afifella pfennigii]
MTQPATKALSIRPARPQKSAELAASAGLSEARIEALVHRFYAKVRDDAALGPIFAERIADWPPHLSKMVDFWSSVALMSGRYHGSPVTRHAGLPVEWAHFRRWLDLFAETARQTCPPEGAAHLIERAERIARSLFLAIERAGSEPAGTEPLAPPAAANERTRR